MAMAHFLVPAKASVLNYKGLVTQCWIIRHTGNLYSKLSTFLELRPELS